MKRIIVSFVMLTFIMLSLSGCKSDDYKKALEYESAGNYESALEIYTELGDYEDSADRRVACQAEIDNSSSYAEGITLMDKMEYKSALELFEVLGDYKDSVEKCAECEKASEIMDSYKSSKDVLDKKNAELTSIISECDLLVADHAVALDETTLPSLETAISEAKSKIVNFPDLPDNIESASSDITDMDSVSYDDVMADVQAKRQVYEKSVKQYQLVLAPSEAYVISCLKSVPNVVDISAVTEDNDPNGNLNKSGGYTAQVYFSSDLVDQSMVLGNSVIEKGTDCGGSIEVYNSPEEALKREEYLASFDGGIFASGSHTVIGSVLIRTSNNLTASQQKEVEQNIISALTFINE